MVHLARIARASRMTRCIRVITRLAASLTSIALAMSCSVSGDIPASGILAPTA
jgi:hypothetical protein